MAGKYTENVKKTYKFVPADKYEHYNDDGRRAEKYLFYCSDGYYPDYYPKVFSDIGDAMVYREQQERSEILRGNNPNEMEIRIIPTDGRKYGVLTGFTWKQDGHYRFVPQLMKMNTETEANMFKAGFERGWKSREIYGNALDDAKKISPQEVSNVYFGRMDDPPIFRFYHAKPAKKTPRKPSARKPAPKKKTVSKRR